MHQIKLFTGLQVVEIEKEVNQYLKEHEDLFVLTIKTTAIPYKGLLNSSCAYIITIVYEE